MTTYAPPSPLLTPFLDGLAFPECPRWHEGALWFSEFYARKVWRVGLDAQGRAVPRLVAEVNGQPGGLGWLPNGRLLVVAMNERRVLRLEPDGELAIAADLSSLVPAACNDMLVDGQGRAYVGNFGFDLPGRAPFAPTQLLRVDPDGTVSVAAGDMHFPNGCALAPGGRTLIVAESYAARLTAFDVAPDGSLGGRRVWARLEGKGVAPDGICLDAEGAAWIASPVSREVLRVREGGEVTHRMPTHGQALACVLGGADRRTLFVLTGQVMVTPEQSREARTGRIDIARVDVPGAGLP